MHLKSNHQALFNHNWIMKSWQASRRVFLVSVLGLTSTSVLATDEQLALSQAQQDLVDLSTNDNGFMMDTENADYSLYFNGANYLATTGLGYAGMSTLGTYGVFYVVDFAGVIVGEALERTGHADVAAYFPNNNAFNINIHVSDDEFTDALEVACDCNIDWGLYASILTDASFTMTDKMFSTPTSIVTAIFAPQVFAEDLLQDGASLLLNSGYDGELRETLELIDTAYGDYNHWQDTEYAQVTNHNHSDLFTYLYVPDPNSRKLTDANGEYHAQFSPYLLTGLGSTWGYTAWAGWDKLYAYSGAGSYFINNTWVKLENSSAFNWNSDATLVGNKTVYANGGNDTIINSDYAEGGGGKDIFDNVYEAYGQNGNDYIRGSFRAYGGDGNDMIVDARRGEGGDGNDTIMNSGSGYGGEGNDQLFNNCLSYGGAGDDYIVGKRYASFSCELKGGDGNDHIKVKRGDNRVSAGSGNDLVEVAIENSTQMYAGTEKLTSSIYGNSGKDSIKVTLSHQADINVTRNNAGRYTFKGIYIETTLGDFEDYLFILDTEYKVNASPIRHNLEVISNRNRHHNAHFISGKGNDLIRAGAGDDRINGGEGNDIIDGGTGNDTLIGGLGDDLIVPGAGIDIIDGSNGFDTITYADETAGIEAIFWKKSVTSLARNEVDTIENVEGIIATNFDDVIAMAGAINNIVSAGAGDDIIHTFGGDDIISAGNGNNRVFAGNGIDTIDYSLSSSSVNVDLANEQATHGQFTDELEVVENVKSSRFNDTITGSDIDNVFYDIDGADSYHGGNGKDTLDYSHSATQHGLDANLSANRVHVRDENYHIQQDRLSSIENLVGTAFEDYLTGDSGANTLNGADGNDYLYGRDGDDILIGGAGHNTLNGGAGNDIFIIDRLTDNHNSNIIEDFQAGDKLKLDAQALEIYPTILGTVDYGVDAQGDERQLIFENGQLILRSENSDIVLASFGTTQNAQTVLNAIEFDKLIPQDLETITFSQINGQLKQISIAEDGTTWGVSANGNIYRRDANSWTKIAGALDNVSVGSANHIWGVSSDNKIWKFNGSGWNQIGGSLTQISVGSDGSVWGVNSACKIYKRQNNRWIRINGCLTQISVGSASQIWGLNASGSIYQRNGNGWRHIAGTMAQVDVAADGSVWASDSSGNVNFYYNEWLKVNDNVKYVSVGSGNQVRVINKDDRIYQANIDNGVVGIRSLIDTHSGPSQVKISLKTFDNKYVVAEGNGGGDVNANRTAVGPWEKFTLVNHDTSTCINDGDQVYLRTGSGHYFRATYPNGYLDARAGAKNAWERFTFKNLTDNVGCLEDGDRIALKSSHGGWINAGNGDANAQLAKLSFPGKFTLNFR